MSFLDRFRPIDTKRDEKAPLEPRRDGPNWKDAVAGMNDKAKAYISRNPDEEKTVKTFLKLLNLESKYRYSKIHSAADERTDKDAKVFLHLSEDKMAAYICVFPPLGGGAELNEEKLLEDLHFEGIRYGIIEEELKNCVAGNRYLEIVVIARGTLPQDGEDGELVECFPRCLGASLEVPADASIDFSNSKPVQMVQKGEVLCRVRQPVPGVEGTDVTGEVYPCRQPETIVIPAGKNTKLSPDGTTLCAAIDGILYSNGKDYNVRQQRIFSDNLATFEGELKIEGDLYIPGDISGGATIEAFGDIIIGGEVRDAHIVSKGGSIRVQKGVHGVKGKTYLSAARQVQALVIESADVEARDNVISETIVNSEVRSGGSVSVLGGRGTIAGGQIRAAKDILCQQIGNLAENRTKVTAGYIAGISDEYERVEKSLSETSAMLAKLWENIGTFRKLGTRITLQQKELLGWLIEQRGLYEQEERKLKAEKKELYGKASVNGAGRIICQRLHPVTEVQIGLHKAEYGNPELNCKIHVRDGVLSLR